MDEGKFSSPENGAAYTSPEHALHILPMFVQVHIPAHILTLSVAPLPVCPSQQRHHFLLGMSSVASQRDGVPTCDYVIVECLALVAARLIVEVITAMVALL